MSFSQDTKNDLCGLSLKKRCCKVSMLYGMLLFSGVFAENRIKFITETESVANLLTGLLHSLAEVDTNLYISEKKSKEEKDERVNSYKLTVAVKSDVARIISLFKGNFDKISEDVFECPACVSSFVRGAFLAAGSVSSPKSAYHLDLTTTSEEIAAELCQILNENALQAKNTERQGRMAVYLKDSEQIQDFLTFIGAQNAALEMMNEKIFKDVRNNENRRSNCETANIYRTTGSSGEQTRAINKLMSDGRFEELPEDLKITAQLRLDNPFSSLEQIALMHTPPISKSGVNHRLKKIVEISKK